ncbi:MAG: hypothetical protein KA408_07215 [Flavobacteriales bacterium]|nr:hypothetical protein [Flavobacteriales bacterium]
MKTTIITVCLAICTAFTAQAQETKGKMDHSTMQNEKHKCMMAGDETWKTLGLTSDQMTKVKEIQKSCNADHMDAKADDKAMASVDKHEEELKGVLTPEQYANYTKWCSEQHGKKMHPEMGKSDGMKSKDGMTE